MKNKKSIIFLLVSQGISLLGSRMTSIALAIWLFESLNRTTEVLLIPFFTELPMMVFASLIGVWVDRYNQKTLMILSDVVQALGSLVLILSLQSQLILPLLFGVVFVQGFFSTMQEISAEVVLTSLTQEDKRMKINSFKEFMFPASGILGPVLAGILYLNGGLRLVLIVDLVSFLLAVICISFVKLEVKVEPHKPSKEGLFAGFSYIKSDRSLFKLLVFIGLFNILVNGPLELITPYVLSLTSSKLFLSSLLAVMSLATLIGSILPAVIKKAEKLKIWQMVILVAIGLVMFGLVKMRLGMYLLVLLMMLPLPIINILFKTRLQKQVPEVYRGRVFAFVYQFAYGLAPLSFLIVGPVVDKVMKPFSQSLTLFNTSYGGMGLMISLSGVVIGGLVLWYLLSRDE